MKVSVGARVDRVLLCGSGLSVMPLCTTIAGVSVICFVVTSAALLSRNRARSRLRREVAPFLSVYSHQVPAVDGAM